MSTQVQQAEGLRPDPVEEVKQPDVSVDRTVVASANPHVSGLDRRIAFLFEHGKSRFFRVNYSDPRKQNYITRSCFVEVSEGKAKEWPNPNPKPGGFDYGNLN